MRASQAGPFSRNLGDGTPATGSAPSGSVINFFDGVANWIQQGNNKWYVFGGVAFALLLFGKGKK